MTEKNQNEVILINHEEGSKLYESINDSITQQLVWAAFVPIQNRFLTRKHLPDCDFDFKFFVEVMTEFFSDHEFIRKTLDEESLDNYF